MSNSSQATPAAPVKKKKKKPATNWKQIIIVGTMIIAGLSMVAPGIFSWIGSLTSNRNAYPTSEVVTPPSTNSATTEPAPASNEAMPEPVFKKEGELFFQPAAGGKAIAKIDIEKAETDQERMQGLMFRKSMDEDKGMLFIMDNNEQQSFFMRNTYIPLDIIFVDENNVINTIHENTKILNDNSLPSNGPAKYVVEVNGGYTKKHGIKVGDKISWQ
ncbi:MAG: DUF192 domain-containing protein [Saprospiraceae bacterium]|jgi:hypothetical protein|nr:DUF192 domain-containing protein [Saprospiraceae bacterium]